MENLSEIQQFLYKLLRPLIIDAVSETLNRQQHSLPFSEKEKEDDLPDIIKVKEAAKELGYKVGYVYQLKAQGDIPYMPTPKGGIRFSRKELRAWMQAGRPKLLQDALDRLAGQALTKNKKGGKHV